MSMSFLIYNDFFSLNYKIHKKKKFALKQNAWNAIFFPAVESKIWNFLTVNKKKIENFNLFSSLPFPLQLGAYNWRNFLTEV